MTEIQPSRASVALFGASGGIGQSIASKLAPQYSHLYLIGRRHDALKELQQKIPHSTIILCDVTQTEQVSAVFQTIRAQKIPLYGIANCVGNILLKPVHRTSLDEWHHVIALNLTSSFLIMHHGIQLLLEQNQEGSILLFGSVAGQYGLSNHEAIAAAKAGIKGLILSAAATYAKQHIRINGIAPGLIETPLAKGLLQNDLSRAASEQMHPLGRIGQPEDLATLAAFMLTKQSSFVTGQMWSVDGGLGSVRSAPGKTIVRSTGTSK